MGDKRYQFFQMPQSASGQVCRVGEIPTRHLTLFPTPEQVGKMGQAIHRHLCAIQIPQAKNNALRVITLLARNHIPELVAAFLDFSSTLDRYLTVSSSLTPLPTLHPSPGQDHSFCLLSAYHSPRETQSAWCRQESTPLFI